jgi:hypothetical protein
VIYAEVPAVIPELRLAANDFCMSHSVNGFGLISQPSPDQPEIDGACAPVRSC